MSHKWPAACFHCPHHPSAQRVRNLWPETREDRTLLLTILAIQKLNILSTYTLKHFLLSLILFIIRFWSSGILKVMNCRHAATDHRISLTFTSRSQLKYLRPKQTSIEQPVHTLAQTMCCWAIWIIYMRSVYRFIGASGAGRINIQERWPPSAR